MKLIGLMSWFDEDPLALLQSVNDLAAIGVTDLIAVGGRYENFPEQPVLRSRMSEVDAILARCSYHKIGLTLDLPHGPWVGDEVAKRQRMLDLADAVSDGDITWLCIWDADYRLFWSDTPTPPRDRLADPGVRSLNVHFTDDPSESPSHWYPMKMFMRWERGLHMADNHHTYVYADGQELQILPRGEDAGPFYPIRVQHLKYRRKQNRLDAQAAYYVIRDEQLLER